MANLVLSIAFTTNFSKVMNTQSFSLSVLNSDAATAITVEIGGKTSGLLQPGAHFEFANLAANPADGLNLFVTPSQQKPLTLLLSKDGKWLQSINGHPGPRILVGPESRFPNTGPLFHLFLDTNQPGVAFVSQVDMAVGVTGTSS